MNRVTVGLTPRGDATRRRQELNGVSEPRASSPAVSADEIAAARFSYPTEDRPTWRTIIAGQEPDDAPSIDPADVAVIDGETGEIVLAAVIENSPQFSEYEALLRWRRASRLAPTFLYVPAGATGHASDLCHESGIRLAGLCGWQRAGDALLIERACLRPFDQPPLVAILPEFLRPERFRTGAGAVPARRVEAPPGHLFDIAVAFGVCALIAALTTWMVDVRGWERQEGLTLGIVVFAAAGLFTLLAGLSMVASELRRRDRHED